MKRHPARPTAVAAVEASVVAGAQALGQTLDPAASAALARYAALVIKWNRVVNLTGAGDAVEFARKFIVDALALRPYIVGKEAADLGSGAGLPGMVLALVLPQIRFHLVEPRTRRARFLEQARIELQAANVQVHCARGEDWDPPAALDVVVCQALGTLGDVLRATAKLRGRRTRLLVAKGQAPHAEVAALGDAAQACTIVPLAVPGWIARHLVCIDCALLGGP